MAVKILTACGAGLGCCQIIEMKLKKICSDLGVDIHVSHTNVSNAVGVAPQYDIVFTSQTLVSNFTKAQKKGVIIVGLKNLTSEKEIKEKITELLASGKLHK